MQPSNFDELTKALAATRSRRHALKLIVTTSVGGLLGLTSISTVFGKRGPKCHRNGLGCDRDNDCCSGYCNPHGKCAVPPCVPAGGNCSTVNNCCSPGICCNGVCCGSGQTCVNNTTCCATANVCGTTCCSSGRTCVNGSCCTPSGLNSLCQANSECCSGMCQPFGVFPPHCCSPSGAPCNLADSGGCCSGTCINGTPTPHCA